MGPWIPASLAALLLTGAAAPVPETVTVHRCVDAKGHVSLQDDPCPKGSQDTTRQMLRPKDPPPRPAAAEPAPRPETVAPPPPAPAPLALPAPPPMYRCTSYDGIERFSEVYDPNPRCEPVGLYIDPRYTSPEFARACHWVEDSCVRLSDEDACAVWKKRQKEAASAALHAFSDTAAYRKSEVERINRIVAEGCP